MFVAFSKWRRLVYNTCRHTVAPAWFSVSQRFSEITDWYKTHTSWGSSASVRLGPSSMYWGMWQCTHVKQLHILMYSCCCFLKENTDVLLLFFFFQNLMPNCKWNLRLLKAFPADETKWYVVWKVWTGRNNNCLKSYFNSNFDFKNWLYIDRAIKSICLS